MIKIKKGVNPINTHHHLVMYGPGGAKQHRYRVRRVTNTENDRPNGEPEIYLSYAGGKTEHFPQTYVSMPLSMFAEDAKPIEASDKFWEDEKGGKIETSEV